MTPAAPQLSRAARLAATLALAAMLALATGGAGLAHCVLAHGGDGHPLAPHAHADTPCDPTPADGPSDTPANESNSHGCDVCTLLAGGTTPPAAPDAAPTLGPATPGFSGVASAAPAPPAAPLPPARGPPSRSA